jgi:hypothetical protein
MVFRFHETNSSENPANQILALCDVDDFASVKAPKAQQRATTWQGVAATRSTTITWDLRNSGEFNNCWNLVRDQGVGGSNPLSPTNLFFPLETLDAVHGKVSRAYSLRRPRSA